MSPSFKDNNSVKRTFSSQGTNTPPVSPIKKKGCVQLISATRQALNEGECRGLLKYFSQSSKEEYANNIARTLDDVRQKSADVKWAKEQIA